MKILNLSIESDILSPLGNIASRIRRGFRAMVSNERATLTQDSGWLINAWGGGGGAVSPATAMRIGAVLACVRLRGRVMSSLPCIVYKREADGTRTRASYMNTYKLVKGNPNPRMNAALFWQVMWANYDLYGNAYAEIQRDAAGLPAYLWPIPAKLVQPRSADGNTGEIDYLIPTYKVKIRSRDMLHLRGFTLDGINGLSAISVAAHTFGLAHATEEYGQKFFLNGGNPKGVLEHPQSLSPEAKQRISDDWESKYGTMSTTQRTAVLQEGMKYTAVTVSPKDVQFLDVRKYNSAQIAAEFHVPARLIGANDGPVGWGSVEQQTLEWSMFGLTPDLVQAEQEINDKLLDNSDNFYAEFNLDALLRADMKTRQEALAIQWEHGAIDTDEWRAMENRGPVKDGDGKRRFLPMNYVPADRVDDVINARANKQPAAPPGTTR